MPAFVRRRSPDARRPGEDSWPFLLLALATFAFYGTALRRQFVSEDFVMIRLLTRDPPWSDLVAHFTSPFAGVTFIKFYRPFAELLLAAEVRLWATTPLGYNLTHVLVHLLNTALVWAIARILARRCGADSFLPPFIAALLFCLHPLHPNTVLFLAAFGTLFGATFFLGAVLLYLLFQQGARGSLLGASVLCFALALASYESSVVLPFLLVAADVLLGEEPVLRRQAVFRYAPFFVLLAGYFALRRHLFGVFVGGYGGFDAFPGPAQLLLVAWNLFDSLNRMIDPSYGKPSFPADLGIFTAVVAAPAACILVRLAREGVGVRKAESARPSPSDPRRTAGLGAFLLLWIVATGIPFAAVRVVPASGRYAYLASAGLGWYLAFLPVFLVRSRRFHVWTLAVGGAALVTHYGLLLAGNLRDYRLAGETAAAIRGEIRAAAKADPAPLFIAGYPLFIENARRVPTAQVFHWGLADASRPPFTSDEIAVYPLGLLGPGIARPLAAGRRRGTVLEWNRATRKLDVVEPGGEAPPAEATIEPLSPPEGSRLSLSRELAEITFRSADYPKLRLMVVTEANSAPMDVPVGPQDPTRPRTVLLPLDFLHLVSTLYRGDVFWWVEAWNEKDERLAFSPVRFFRVVE